GTMEAGRHARRGRAGRAFGSALVVLALTSPAVVRAQAGTANFAGTWKLSQADPPVAAGRGGRGAGGGGISGPYADTILAAAPDAITIAQTGSQLTVQIGAAKAVYTPDDKTMSDPPGEALALKTRAPREGTERHLAFHR